jgi:eukaryotic-like serine/threonine-protein kinase
MTIRPGTILGPYEIVAPIGAGGMGEVWKGRDTRLDREVAIKVLPPGFADNEQFRARFDREAKTISSLNHPNICTLFDVGHEEGVHFLVMELIDGESLADRLAKGPLPLDQLIRYGAQVAEALDRAHKQGVVHRDLKPGNVMITKAGAKLLDFGLARSAAEAPVRGLTEMPTQAKPLTQEGTILGTFQYMAPEQLEGLDADARTDIFALGALLYEMATGQRAFKGESRTSLIAAIVSAHPPPISTVAPLTPPVLEHVIRKCLEKDPEDRWQSAHDVASELRWISEAGSQVGVPAQVTSRRKSLARAGWLVAAVLALTTAAALWWASTLATPPLRETRPIRSAILPPYDTTFSTTGRDVGSIAVSPDGTRIVFAAGDSKSRTMLYVRPLESAAAQPLAGTEGGGYPFWSPDGTQIAFFASGKLLKIAASGGAAFTICEASDGRGGSWSSLGVIAFAPATQTGLSRVAAAGGQPAPLTEIDPSTKETTHRYPWFLPDGKSFVYFAGSHNLSAKDEVHGVYLSSLDHPKTRRRLASSRSNAQVSQDTLLFLRDQFLMAQRLDPNALELRGDPFPVAESVQFDANFFAGPFSVSQNGILAYRVGVASRRALLVVDERGEVLKELGPPAQYERANVSPDGRRVAVTLVDEGSGNEDIWVFDVERGTKTRISFGETPDRNPIWSPDGTRIAWQSGASGNGDIYVRSASGSGAEEVLHTSPALDDPEDWSPDGRFIAFNKIESNKTDIWILDVETGKAEALITGEFEEGWPHFSPDGRWLAYLSNEAGTWQAYVVRFPNVKDGRWQIPGGAEWILGWGSDGSTLYVIDGEYDVVRVTVSLGENFEAGETRKLFRTESNQTWDRFGDGKRFVIGRSPEKLADNPITLVVDWLPEETRNDK